MTGLFFPLLLDMIHRGTGGISMIMAICAVFLALFILFKHRENISRILKGEESKFSFKKSVKTEAEKKASEDKSSENGSENN